jgi:O-antigen ligase
MMPQCPSDTCSLLAVPYDGRISAPSISSRIATFTVVSLLVAQVFVPEYLQDGGTAAKSALYSTCAGQFRIVDVAITALALAHAFALGCIRGRHRHLPKRLICLLAGFSAVIALSLWYGVQHGGRNLFFDWRAIALGAGLYIVYRFWVRTQDDSRVAIYAFGVVAGAEMMLLSASYFAGRGESLLGVRIPLYDGPGLSALVFTALLGLCLSGKDFPFGQRWLWLTCSAAATLVVLLSFRRTYWAELAIAVAILLMINSRHSARTLLLLLMFGVTASLWMGRPLLDRFASLDVRDSESRYSADNVDHVSDLLDAWDQVCASPIMGIGLGRSYPTWRIRNWKDESVMVHNAPLHVWLKYGLLGLILYLTFHLCLFGRLLQYSKRAPPSDLAIANAVLAYVAAQFVVSLGFAPWPYSSLQSTNLTAFLLAVVFTREFPCRFQQFRSSRPASTPPLTLKTRYSA